MIMYAVNHAGRNRTIQCLGADVKHAGAHDYGLNGECRNPVCGFGGGMLRSFSKLVHHTMSRDDGGASYWVTRFSRISG